MMHVSAIPPRLPLFVDVAMSATATMTGLLNIRYIRSCDAAAGIVAFDNRGQCHVDQVVSDSTMDTNIGRITVQAVDGSQRSYDVSGSPTLRTIVFQDWHGVAGENDRYKLIADSGTGDLRDNLYMFGDGDAANYDPGGCPAALMENGAPQVVCPGTPSGLLSLGHHATNLAGDFGECNYRSDWGWVVRAMWILPAAMRSQGPAPEPQPSCECCDQFQVLSTDHLTGVEVYATALQTQSK